ncbi:hypothetical protein [Dactylosporangium sp. CA-233914]|uniref:hypothetical protein n=1 Tax=Dactylosporangium sp. CA-233914 TaxID=3239934 RepID=UPI003D939F07
MADVQLSDYRKRWVILHQVDHRVDYASTVGIRVLDPIEDYPRVVDRVNHCERGHLAVSDRPLHRSAELGRETAVRERERHVSEHFVGHDRSSSYAPADCKRRHQLVMPAHQLGGIR